MNWPAIKRELLRRGDIETRKDFARDCEDFRMRGSPMILTFYRYAIEDGVVLTRRDVRRFYNSMRRRRVYT